MMEMCSSASASIKTKNNFGKRTEFGRLSFRLCEVYKPYMSSAFCIATWRVQIYSSTRTRLQNWATWTFPRWPKMACAKPKQEPHIMPVLRYGKMNPTTWSLIYGLWAVLSTRCALWCLLSGLMTWEASVGAFLGASTLQFQVTTPWICACWSRLFYKYRQQQDLILNRSSRCLSSFNG